MNRFRAHAGFTLAETLIGFTVVVVALTATTALVASSIRGNALNRDRLIAYHLAAEGLELLRNARDGNWLQNQGWRTGDPLHRGVSWATNGAYLAERDLEYVSTREGTPVIVRLFDPAADRSCLTPTSYQGGVLYRHAACGAASPALFRRVLFVRDPEATVESRVMWHVRGTEQVVSLTTRLTDWKPLPL